MSREKCFYYCCRHFPDCYHAMMTCGVDDWTEPEDIITESNYTEANGLPLYEKKTGRVLAKGKE